MFDFEIFQTVMVWGFCLWFFSMCMLFCAAYVYQIFKGIRNFGDVYLGAEKPRK